MPRKDREGRINIQNVILERRYVCYKDPQRESHATVVPNVG